MPIIKDPTEKPKVARSWKPAELLQVTNKDPRFTYRWLSNNPVRIAKAKQEGWEILNRTSSTSEQGPPQTLADGSNVAGTVNKRELILARMPKELSESRAKYFESKSNLKDKEAEFKQIVGGVGYGEIQIEEK